jgi:predicted acylesterase/phospholipase RssA
MKKCDLVMKGGITSGIVYPGVVCKLAEVYEFQNIGGTSAGGIAAALTAAAELARRQGRNVFPDLAEVPKFLGSPSPHGNSSTLFTLFQPQPAMRRLFRLAIAFLRESKLGIVAGVLGVLWVEGVSALVFAVLVAVVGWHGCNWRSAAACLLALLALVAGLLLTVLIGLLIRLRRLPSHHFGFCFGYTKRDSDKEPISLVEWLNDKLNSYAGLTGRPLTFGDLKHAVSEENPDGITLKMISTCLTLGRPFTLPFETHKFYFSSEEMRHYFPKEVVQWMEDHPAPLTEDEESHRVRSIDSRGLNRLPAEDDLPVIVAVRLSLSFPVLFCAVPLYAVDFSLREKKDDQPPPAQCVAGLALAPNQPYTPEQVWFADGGITSNFPFHLFDAPIPRWPTFGLDLDDLRCDMTESSPRTWIPKSNGGGIAPTWTRLSTKPSFVGILPFATSMIDAARNWMDNLQAAVPGYRDRIVHVYLSKREGGLNLNMPSDVLTALSTYGEQAAQHLIDHFVHGTDGGDPTPMTWDNHRWIRYRSTIALLQKFLDDYAQGVERREPGDVDIMTLVTREKDDPPKTGYPFTAPQREFATNITAELCKLGDKLRPADGTERVDLGKRGPSPTPALRVRPRF